MKYIVFIFSATMVLAQSTTHQTIGFYNVENLFDHIDDPLTYDNEYTPEGEKKWSNKHLNQKINQLSSVIASVGFRESLQTPLLMGLAEVENHYVLDLLINSPLLKASNYGIVHFESPDFRGIDVGLLYKASLFNVVHQKRYSLELTDNKTGYKRTTRDILVVGGYFYEHYLSIIVNHWPSRRGGKKRSAAHRFKAAQLHRHITDSIQKKRPTGYLISMGDFNDNPSDKSIQWITQKEKKGFGLYNPMIALHKKGEGSLAFNDRWFLFDQILFSQQWKKQKFLHIKKTAIYHPIHLITPRGRYQGYPFRTDINGPKLRGYSDHFPVYTLIEVK